MNRIKPLEQKIAEGDRGGLGKRKLEARRKVHVQAENGMYGPPPAEFDEDAAWVWKEWTRALEYMDLDRKPDIPNLRSACMAYSQMNKAWRQWQQEEMIINGRPNPIFGIHERASLRVLRFSQEFGFTPLARERISLHREVPKDKPRNDKPEPEEPIDGDLAAIESVASQILGIQ